MDRRFTCSCGRTFRTSRARRECASHPDPDARDRDATPAPVPYAVAEALAGALERARLYITLHAQEHPEWNGNRFDDDAAVTAALAAWERHKKG